MTSRKELSVHTQAQQPGRGVLHYYIVDPEERFQLGWRADQLVQLVAETNPDIVFFLDKSGRPIQHLFRKAWKRSQEEGEVEAGQFPRQIGFLHIGRGGDSLRNRQRLLASKDLPQLASYYRRKLGGDPLRVLVVDEILGSGETMELAFEVVDKMFPGVSLGKFFLQDSTGRTELFVKPGGDRQATWKMSLEDHLAYGLQGATDVYYGIRKEYADILAFPPRLRKDWAEQLWAMEGECVIGFAVRLRITGTYVFETLDSLASALTAYTESTPAKRGVRYAVRIKEALQNGLPHIRKGQGERVLAHETIDEVRMVTRDQVAWLRVAACYMNKLLCMLDAVKATAQQQSLDLTELQFRLTLQAGLFQDLAHWASEWEASRLFEQYGPSALGYEIGMLRAELAECVSFYWRYRRRELPAPV